MKPIQSKTGSLVAASALIIGGIFMFNNAIRVASKADGAKVLVAVDKPSASAPTSNTQRTGEPVGGPLLDPGKEFPWDQRPVDEPAVLAPQQEAADVSQDVPD